MIYPTRCNVTEPNWNEMPFKTRPEDWKLYAEADNQAD